MSEPQLTFNALAKRLHGSALPLAEPAPDLWRRIVERHTRAQQRARRRRALAAGAALLAVAAVIGAALRAPRADRDIDWQARAQALELRLHATAPPAAAGAAAVTTQAQLAQLDALLQAAYDNGADHNEVVALWKRRSELLDALLRERTLDSDRT